MQMQPLDSLHKLQVFSWYSSKIKKPALASQFEERAQGKIIFRNCLSSFRTVANIFLYFCAQIG
jgi:hypothetical protein